ncbi:hypothetical protein ABZ490_43830 [Streptomyces sp. NPDC005811]|uniref:hypothetical protein n=1 Tax=Streptomyces sp. NPDC005811 TaxID=3154565 RepID=UPI0034076A2B
MRAGDSATAEELQRFLNEDVAASKNPGHVWLVDALPMGAGGKIFEQEVSAPTG